MDKLKALGLIFPVSYGIQIDVNAVNKQLPNGQTVTGSLCDHNCTRDVGGYDCPAAFTVNRGFKPHFASAESIINWVLAGRESLRLATEQFLEHHFSGYCAEFNIPHDVSEALYQNMKSGTCEVNLFGGNPEMHPQIFEIIRTLKSLGFRVNLTTTGRKPLTSREFTTQLAIDTPHLLALSADDVDPDRLEDYLTMPLDQLKAVWKKIPPLNGQAQKFVEGIYTARQAMLENWPCTVLFNMVLHKGNLPHFRQIMQTITKHLPKVLLNPYPAQDSFDHGPGDLFDAESISLFSSLVDWFIQETIGGNANLTKRLQSWLVMRAVLDNCQDHPVAASKLISGHGIWQCYRRTGAGMYLQIGKGNNSLINIGDPEATEPGGYPGCYWNNSTVTGNAQVTTAEHLLSGMQEHAKASTKPCPGCSMLRLWFNMAVTELGLNPGLVATYLGLRYKHAGF